MQHPHAEATYRVVALKDGGFGVEVMVPGSHPATVSGFKTQDAAETWLADHKNFVSTHDPRSAWAKRRSPATPRRG